MTHIKSVRNIGPKSAQWLESVGIRTADDLEAIGAVEAYRHVKIAYPEKVTLNLLWGLQGPILGIEWNLLPDEMKEQLKRQLGRG